MVSFELFQGFHPLSDNLPCFAIVDPAPGGEERDSAKRTMGIGLTSKLLKDVDISQKKSSCRTYIPPPERNGTPTKDDGGGLEHLDLTRKNVAAGPIPPGDGRT